MTVGVVPLEVPTTHFATGFLSRLFSEMNIIKFGEEVQTAAV